MYARRYIDVTFTGKGGPFVEHRGVVCVFGRLGAKRVVTIRALLGHGLYLNGARKIGQQSNQNNESDERQNLNSAALRTIGRIVCPHLVRTASHAG